VEAGQRIGFIKFGSRVDLILPEGWEITVKEGDKVTGGVTVIGYLQ
jgi:phosphatidylserine decarboxylase